MTTAPHAPTGSILLTGIKPLVEATERQPVFDAILIRDGKVAVRGSAAVLTQAHPEVRCLDLDGMHVGGGLVNAHTHAPMGFFRGLGHLNALPKTDDGSMIEDFFFPSEAKLTEELLEPLSYSYLLDGLRSGVTCFVDVYFYAHKVADAMNRLGVRGFVGEHIADLGGPLPAGQALWDKVKTRIDHWAHGDRVRPLVYAHATDTVSEGLLRSLGDFARQRRLPFHMHLSQTAGERQRVMVRAGMSPVQYAEKAGVLGEHALVTHLVSASDEDLRLLASTGTTFAFCPVSEIIYEQLPPISTILDLNIPVALGTDCAASNDTADMMQELRFTAIILKMLGVDPRWREPGFLRRMVAANAANVLGLPLPDLSVGSPADLVFYANDISLEPMSQPQLNLIYSFSSRHVRHVMVAGEFVLWDGQPTRCREADLREAYRAAVREIKKRAALP